jgi:glycosyltransferase involved in cell wall biosynthesis
MILFDAIYLNSLGGKNLLKLVISKIEGRKQWGFIIDSRLKSEYTLSKRIKFENPSVLSRFFFYLNKNRHFNSIFCFSNIPPPFKTNKRVFIFFHNDNLIEPSIVNTTKGDKLILKLKSFYIKCLSFDNYKWIVQTNYMKNRLNLFFNIRLDNIFVIPIFDDSKSRIHSSKRQNDFLYVSDFQPHKNHDNLIKAFILHSNKSESQINLHLTIPNNKYDSFIKKYVISQNLNIINHGVCDESQINDLYSKCKYFIFPSIKESFGLPLIEACQNDCHVIASNLEYVTEIIKPSLSFDPLNIDSIASSIETALNTKSLKTSKILVKNKLDLLIETIEQNV